MNFRELLQKLEARVGYHQVPLNPAARSLKDLFECSPLHPELIVRLAQAIHAENGCRSLNDPVYRHSTFDAFAPIRLQILNAKNTDIDTYRLIDELATAIERAFRAPLDAAEPALLPIPIRKTAEIIPLAPRRGRKLKIGT
ncbi:MAG: hypothetical protein ACLGHO_03905 [Gammaproteobacteria bacterium]